MSNISIKKASVIFALSKYSNLVINLIITIVLARLLSPYDFGIIALLEVFAYLFILMSEIGISSGIIQNKELTDQDNNSLFSLTIYFGLILMVLFAFSGIPVSIIYGTPIYKYLVPLISISVFFNAINIVPNATLLKQFDFKSIAKRNIIVNVVAGLIAVFLAFFGFRYYALIAFNIINAILLFVWNYSKKRFKFLYRVSFQSLKKILNYSIYQFLFSIVNYFSRNTDKILIGKYFNSEVLGYYDKSYKTLLYPVGYLTNVITPVLHPILSNNQNDHDIILEKYLKVVKFLSIIGVFATGGAFIASAEIILILFGEKWISVVPIFHILSLSIWFQMISSSSGAIFQSAGNTRKLFFTSIFTFATTICLVIAGILTNNISSLAYFVLISYILNFITTFIMLIKFVLRKSISQFFLKIIPDYTIVAIIIILSKIINIDIVNIYISFVFKGLITVLGFIIGIIVTSQVSLITNFLKEVRK